MGNQDWTSTIVERARNNRDLEKKLRALAQLEEQMLEMGPNINEVMVKRGKLCVEIAEEVANAEGNREKTVEIVMWLNDNFDEIAKRLGY